MSNHDDFPPRPSDDPTPDQGIGALAEPPSGAPATPPIDATQVFPVVPTLPESSPSAPSVEPVGGVTAAGPYAAPPQAQAPEPWYRKSGAVAGILLVFAALVAGIIFLIVASGDDDNADGVIDGATPETVSLVVSRFGSDGRPLDTSLSASVAVAPDGSAYAWVIPAEGVVGEAAVRATDAAGRVEFRWTPSQDADPASWASTVEIAEFIAAEGANSVTGLAVDCALDRDGSSEPLVVVADARFDEVNDSLDTIGSYTFPNVNLLAGDRVTCTSTNVVPDAAPVVTESSTVPESTTTILETTTVAETTTVPETTAVPETTVAETTTTVAETTTTVAETTTTVAETTTTTTEPPPVSPELGEFLSGRSDLTDAVVLLDRVGIIDEREASDEPFTLFVPTNDAIDAALGSDDPPDLDDDDVVRELFGAHLVVGAQLDDPSTVTEVEVSSGAPQPIDADANPITIGGVRIISIGNEVEGGVVHLVDRVLPVQS